MKVEYLNPILKATYDVFNRMLDLETERGNLSVVEEMVTGKEANVIIGMTGDISGTILFSFPEKMTLEIVKIMSGMEMTELDMFVTSAMGEIANIISGNAVTYLAGENYQCDIVPPQIIVGVNKFASMAAEKALSVSMNTAIGQFDILVSLKENQEKSN